MCDCFDLTCKCGKFYVPIHISDFSYPREIIKRVYCPYCDYRGPSIKEVKKVVKRKKHFYVIETNGDGEFAIDNWVFHSGITRGEEGIKEEIVHLGKRFSGYFAIEYDKKHPDYKSGKQFMDESVSFNGNPNNVDDLVSDCYRYNCRNIIKKKKKEKHFWEKIRQFYMTDYCKKYRKEVWEIRKQLQYDCKFLKTIYRS